jgi:hypothetical protein
VPLVPTERETVQFTRNLKELKITTKAWEKQRKQQLEADLVKTKTIFKLYMTLQKEALPPQNKKTHYYPWKSSEGLSFKLEKKNGDKKARHFGYTVEMKIQNSSRHMQKVGK